MKRIVTLAGLLICALSLSSCSAAQGLSQSLGRTLGNATKSVGSLGSAITR